MKKEIGRKLISALLSLSIVASMTTMAIATVGAAEIDDSNIVSAGTGAFEADNSYLTREQYNDLGFNLGSAQSMDKNQTLNPLLGSAKSTSEKDTTLKYTGNVKYGWSNPQVLSVMLSSPYWDELDYGTDMSAAGSTSITVSSGFEESEGNQSSVTLGVTLATEMETTVGGNGVVINGDLELSSEKVTENQKAKATESSVTLTGGANTDNVVLCVMPMAFYEYEVYVEGQSDPQYMYAQVPLGTVFSIASLDTYNQVAREANYSESLNNPDSEDLKMTVIDMDEIYPNYTAGDPSTYFTSESDFPVCYTIEDGHMTAMDSETANDENEVQGKIYKSNTEYSISPDNADTGGTISYTGSSSETTTYSQSYALNASVSAGIKAGADVFGVTATSTVSIGVMGGMECLTSNSTVNSKSISCSVGYVDLPSSATSEYGYSASLFVWTPTYVGSSVSGCPCSIIGSIVMFADDYPLYLPDGLHVSAVTKDSVTLGWSNPNFSISPYKERQPESYNICMQSKGNTTSYSVKATVPSDCESVTIKGLNSGTDYTFALQSVNDTDSSVIGPSVSITTSTDSLPVITTQPTDVYVEEGGDVIFTVGAEPSESGNELTFQWQKLTENRYGTSWSDISGATSSTFNPSVVNSANRYELDDSIYRCIVSEDKGTEIVNTVSNVAEVTVAFVIDDYDELCDVAEMVNNGNEKYSKYVLANDITVPENTEWTTPIGTKENPFEGSFDGQGHTISGLNVYDTRSELDYYGLFGFVNGGTIKNVNISDTDITIVGPYTGGLCGYIENGIVSNCSISGKIVTANSDVTGGVCGYAETSTITECMNYADVYGSGEIVGGICGYGTPVIIKNCGNQGEVVNYNSSNTTGGICGYAQKDSVVMSCYNVGSVSSDSNAKADAYAIARIDDGGSLENCYFLSGVVSHEEYSEGTSKTAEQFASGEVAYLLNNGVIDGTQAWYQTIGSDSYPVLISNDKNAVYKIESSNETYTNGSEVGDVDCDGHITVKDASIICKNSASMTDLSDYQLMLGDVNGDSIVNVSDSTYIQKMIVELV